MSPELARRCLNGTREERAEAIFEAIDDAVEPELRVSLVLLQRIPLWGEPPQPEHKQFLKAIWERLH